MTSFEFFKLLKFETILHFIYVFNVFLLIYIICDKLHQLMKKFQMFCIKIWYNN